MDKQITNIQYVESCPRGEDKTLSNMQEGLMDSARGVGKQHLVLEKK